MNNPVFILIRMNEVYKLDSSKVRLVSTRKRVVLSWVLKGEQHMIKYLETPKELRMESVSFLVQSAVRGVLVA